MMLPLYQVDSFSNEPFSGNPAAVCLLKPTTGGVWPLSDDMLLRIAAENNLSETAFILPKNSHSDEAFSRDDHFFLRWFTPTREVDLCGHATLASAAILQQKCRNNSSSLHFHTKSGELIASIPHGGKMIEMELPLNPPISLSQPAASIDALINILVGSDNKDIVKDILYNKRTKKLVIELNSAMVDRRYLESLTVSPHALLSVNQSDLGDNAVTGVIVTLIHSSQEYDFLSRYFAPWNGIDEDPVTGSAHTVIAPMWASKLNGQRTFRARQCSPRGGDLELEVEMSEGKLFIRGHAYVVIEGNLRIN